MNQIFQRGKRQITTKSYLAPLNSVLANFGTKSKQYLLVQIYFILQILLQYLQPIMQAPKICVLGSANVDSFVYVKHIPVPGQTIQAHKYMIANGGKGANQAAAAGKLAGSAIFTGQVGLDDEMRNLKKEMTEANVTLMWKQLPDSHTGKAFIYVDETSGQNSIVIIGGANIHYDNLSNLPDTYKSAIDQCTILQLQKQIPMEMNVLAAKYAKQKGKLVMLDCGGRDDEIPAELIENLDYISPNETEVLRIAPDLDIDNPVEEIRGKIISKYPKLKVLLKLGSKGSTLITDKISIHGDVATKINKKVLEKYKIVDTVGAGDCFTSAFCVKLLETDWSDESQWPEYYRKALVFGNSAAFLCITKKGAMPAMPDRKTTDQFIQQFGLFNKTVPQQPKVQVKVAETVEVKVQQSTPQQLRKQPEAQLKVSANVQVQKCVKTPVVGQQKECDHKHEGHGHHGHGHGHGHHGHHQHHHGHHHEHHHGHGDHHHGDGQQKQHYVQKKEQVGPTQAKKQ